MIEIIPACDIGAAIEQERASLEFRPTAVVLARTKGLYLLVEPKREESEGMFWPIQGGLELGEPPLVGAAREAKEETGLEVCPDRIVMLDGVRYANSRLRDGYTVGKLFFGCFVDFSDRNSRCGSVRANPEEIKSIRYASEEEIRQDILPTNLRLRPKTAPKAEFVRHLLGQVASL